jgi:hypothetical protein
MTILVFVPFVFMTARAANPFGIDMVMFLLSFAAVEDSSTAAIFMTKVMEDQGCTQSDPGPTSFWHTHSVPDLPGQDCKWDRGVESF